jgi:hypothetical protein
MDKIYKKYGQTPMIASNLLGQHESWKTLTHTKQPAKSRNKIVANKTMINFNKVADSRYKTPILVKPDLMDLQAQLKPVSKFNREGMN